MSDVEEVAPVEEEVPPAVADLVSRLVADRIQVAVDRAVHRAVEKNTEEITARLQANYETQIEHFQMEINDPTKTDGATYVRDDGKGYVFGLIEVDAIEYNPKTNRTEEDLAPDNPDLQPLIEDVQARGGIVRPLLVYRKKKEPGKYVLIKGHRRLAALRAMDEELVQAYVMPAKPPPGMEDEWVNGF